MKLINTTLTNFRLYQEASLDLADRGLVLISGANGSGKSSLFESINWCLYGSTSKGRKGKNISRGGEGGTRVVVNLQSNGSNLEVARHYGYGKEGNKLIVFADGSDKTLGTNPATQEWLNECLGIDQTTFQNVALLPQKAEGFAGLTDSSQKYILDTILRTSRFEDAKERTKASFVKIESSATRIESTIFHLKKEMHGLEMDRSANQMELAEFERKKKNDILDAELKLEKHLRSVMEDPATYLSRIEAKREEIVALNLNEVRLRHNQCIARIAELSQEQGALAGKVQIYEQQLAEIPKVEPEKVEHDAPFYANEVTRVGQMVSHARARLTVLEDVIKRAAAHSERQGKIDVCDRCGQNLSIEAKQRLLGTIQTEALRAESEVIEVRRDLAESEKLHKFNQEMFTAADYYEQWSGSVTAINKLDECRIALEAYPGKIELIDSKRRELEASVDHYNKLDGELKDLEHIYQLKSEALSHWKAEKENLEQSLDALRKQTSPYEDLIARATLELNRMAKQLDFQIVVSKELQQKKNILAYWVDAFSNKGVKSLLLDTVIGTLNYHAQQYMDILSDGFAKITFDNRTSTAAGEDREKFSVQVEYVNGGGEYKDLSGGEEQRANLATFFAVGDLSEGQGSSKVHLRMLDEPFESCDEAGAEAIISLLQREVAPRTGSVFCITHQSSMADLFTHSIRVRKVGRVSYLEAA